MLEQRTQGARRRDAVAPRLKNLDRDLPGRRVAHGINMGLTPVVFAALGYGIDRALGTLPVFMLALAVFSIAGLLVSSYYRFKAATEPVAGGGRTQ